METNAGLPARRERPRGRAAEQRDERAALYLRPHSISSSARPVSGSDIEPERLGGFEIDDERVFVRPLDGRSPGFTPLKMRST